MMIDALLSNLTGRMINTVPKVNAPDKVQKRPDETPQPDKTKNTDKVLISSEARTVKGNEALQKTQKIYGPESGRKSQKSEECDKTGNNSKLTEEEQKEVDKLKDRENEVVQHETAHKTAGAPYTSGPYYEYETGPDNKRYITGGHVDIDTSEVEGDPDATIKKAQVIQRSASAPGEMSSSDRSAMTAAARMETQARMEKLQQQSGETDEDKITPDKTNNNILNTYSKSLSDITPGQMLNITM